MAENEGGIAAPDNSPSLTSMVGEMYGDYRDAEPESDAGAPPSATPETTDTDVSEGSALASSSASEPAGAPPAEADAALTAAPDSSTPEALSDLDPLEGAKPLDYLVDGQSRTYDGITVLKDGGGIIDPDAMAKVQRVFSERDHLFEKDRQNHERYSALEKATSWTVKDAQGNRTVLTGAPALIEQRAVLGRAIAQLDTLAPLMQGKIDPTSLIGLDENNNVVWNMQALKELSERAQFNAERAAFGAQRYFDKLVAPAPAQAAVEQPVESLAAPTIDLYEKEYQVAGLTAEDKAYLTQLFPRFARPSTPAEQQQGFGPRVVDPSFLDVMKDRAALRANTAKVATAATTAATTNAARLAAASVGKGAKQAPRIPPRKTPEPTRADDFDTMWDRHERAAAGALKARA